MTIDQEELSEILHRLAKKIGLDFEEQITMKELCKKINNQNLCYQSENREINLLRPNFKNGFFIKNAELDYDKDGLHNNFEHDYIIGVKLINGHEVQLKDINNKKINIPYNGDNVRVKFENGIPLDLYFKLMN